jgi:hypothetical protein
MGREISYINESRMYANDVLLDRFEIGIKKDTGDLQAEVLLRIKHKINECVRVPVQNIMTLAVRQYFLVSSLD